MGHAVAVMAEVALWWAALSGLWLTLVSAVDALELVVGGSAALLAALAASRARRAVAGR
ncbi:hypothetical protein ACPXCE_17625 [Streptomyces sp. DT24]|uniref:hypothetical protein n=1 Tax=unclassified Streptomyces TaxID=2593676 RepID=UPI0023B8F5DF|nr:hypothetical protein [Streptomyces sp. AM 4-1-1]WEH32061.1 hypothetical protein PZB75_00900 [Streptomyces sp. AM 4-1-1]